MVIIRYTEIRTPVQFRLFPRKEVKPEIDSRFILDFSKPRLLFSGHYLRMHEFEKVGQETVENLYVFCVFGAIFVLLPNIFGFCSTNPLPA